MVCWLVSREYFLRCARLLPDWFPGLRSRRLFPRRLPRNPAFGSLAHFAAFVALQYRRTWLLDASSSQPLSFNSIDIQTPVRCDEHITSLFSYRYKVPPCNPHRLISLQNTRGEGYPALFTARSAVQSVWQMVTSRIGGAARPFLLDCVLVYETVDAGLYPALGNGTGSVS